MAGNPYRSYQAGVLHASVVTADTALREAKAQYISMFCAGDLDAHELWDLFNQASDLMRKIRSSASLLSEDTMSGRLP